jgi:type II secretory pathway pseudopilin PulG
VIKNGTKGAFLSIMENQHSATFRATRRRQAGFTVVETVFAASLLALFVCTSVMALTQINRWATAARLRTLALAVAQQKIDEVQTTPWQQGNVRPTVISSGTTTDNSIPLNNDDFNNATGLSSAFTGLDTSVNAVRTTQITDVTARVFRAVVTVTFSYRNRPYSLSLTTLRTLDSI